MNVIRRNFGLRWSGRFPRVPWRLWIEALAFAVLMFTVYALVDYIARSAALSDRAAISERKRVQAEASLAACLNGGSLEAGTDEGFIMCEKALWVKL